MRTSSLGLGNKDICEGGKSPAMVKDIKERRGRCAPVKRRDHSEAKSSSTGRGCPQHLEQHSPLLGKAAGGERFTLSLNRCHGFLPQVL